MRARRATLAPVQQNWHPRGGGGPPPQHVACPVQHAAACAASPCPLRAGRLPSPVPCRGPNTLTRIRPTPHPAHSIGCPLQACALRRSRQARGLSGCSCATSATRCITRCCRRSASPDMAPRGARRGCRSGARCRAFALAARTAGVRCTPSHGSDGTCPPTRTPALGAPRTLAHAPPRTLHCTISPHPRRPPPPLRAEWAVAPCACRFCVTTLGRCRPAGCEPALFTRDAPHRRPCATRRMALRYRWAPPACCLPAGGARCSFVPACSCAESCTC